MYISINHHGVCFKYLTILRQFYLNKAETVFKDLEVLFQDNTNHKNHIHYEILKMFGRLHRGTYYIIKHKCSKISDIPLLEFTVSTSFSLSKN